MSSQENFNWSFDSALIDDIHIPDPNFVNPNSFNWALSAPPNLSVEIDGTFGDSEGPKHNSSKKRCVLFSLSMRSFGSSLTFDQDSWGRTESCGPSSSKACREKLRRDRLNDKFMELGSILEPGRPPKTDKVAILIDAVRMVNQLRSEAQKLKDSNSNLQEKIKELKAEKNELRDEKQRLKNERDKLEQQLKTTNTHPGFLHPTTAIPAPFAPPQAPGGKMVPFVSYPGVAMWQFMPPASVDTSQDHMLRPPVA